MTTGLVIAFVVVAVVAATLGFLTCAILTMGKLADEQEHSSDRKPQARNRSART